MPSVMIHLLAAYKYDPNSSGLFWVGNIAPDCISGWKEKDRLHLRDCKDRLNALGELALKEDLHNDFNKGIIFHLYLDYKWDISAFKGYIEENTDENWLWNYRHEIALASAWYYHRLEWTKRIWDDIMAYTEIMCDNNFGYNNKDIVNYISGTYKWHNENNIGPSSVFPPEYIEKFTDKAVVDFKNWLTELE
jgi:hypothetical protein